MFELRTALSYLLPKKGQISVSVVGILAVLVIQAITWLVLVFFSTTEGFENRWTEKITGILGPARIIPTSAYFDSPEYILESYSHETGFSNVRFSKKAEQTTLFYDPAEDPPVPLILHNWYDEHKRNLPLIPSLLSKIGAKHLTWRFFESTICHLTFPTLLSNPQKSVSQYTYVIGYDSLPITKLPSTIDFTLEDFRVLLHKLHSHQADEIPVLRSFIDSLGQFVLIITEDIVVPSSSLRISQGTKLKAFITFDETPILHLLLPTNEPVLLFLDKEIPRVSLPKSATKESLFLLRNPIGKEGHSPLSFVHSLGYPLLLPKASRAQGIEFFDKGFFQIPDVDAKESLSIPFYVAGFFDPGILPTGGKLAITSREAVLAIEPRLSNQSPFASSGIVFDIDKNDLPKAMKTLNHIVKKYFPGLFSVQQYDQYELTSEIYQQLSSEKLLFRMLSIIIIVVACSNIFSMLFILAHDRRKEIAVMRALGASKLSITSIFLLTGIGIGLFGSLLGAGLASLTLHYLPEILTLLGKIQGHELLHPAIYGQISPQKVSLKTLLFTLSSVTISSALAGSFAALRACRINISESLKGGG